MSNNIGRLEAGDRIQAIVREEVRDIDTMETDNDGQLVIYTNIFRWSDGTYSVEREVQ